MSKVVYLSPSFDHYRVPVFEHLHRELGEGFVVVVNSRQVLENSMVAQIMGTFPRVILKGRQVMLSRRHDRGDETPLGMTLTPGLASTLAKLRPEVVISNNFNLWTLTSVVMKFPTIVFWEGTEHTERTLRPWRLHLRRWMAAQAKAFVVNGQLSRAYLTETVQVPPSKILVGGLCAHPPPKHLSAVRPRAPSESDPVRFLYVGRLIERKGPSHLVHAAAMLKRRFRSGGHFEVVLVGDGPERGALNSLVRELEVTDCVRFAGVVTYERVWDSYMSAHVFVLPTLQDNWPLVVPEAMSMAMPVLLSSYTGSAPDLLLETQNGYTFDPADHEQLASQMAKYVEDRDLIVAHGAWSSKIVTRYTPASVAEVFLRAVENVRRQLAAHDALS